MNATHHIHRGMWKLVGKITPRKPKYLLGIYGVPEEALRLNEDIRALEDALRRIRSIDTLNIMESRLESERATAQILIDNVVRSLLRWKRYAEEKQRREYLAP